ncbi:hypothetical protein GCM10023196_069270 [Actinoallomurus vinaceus]|uniref:Uncharacterized protein n=1 Tax=Actinoallomurus vinaceus TaxID=1080074 RepID=A0ABP8UJB7_9ACTN
MISHGPTHPYRTAEPNEYVPPLDRDVYGLRRLRVSKVAQRPHTPAHRRAARASLSAQLNAYAKWSKDRMGTPIAASMQLVGVDISDIAIWLGVA